MPGDYKLVRRMQRFETQIHAELAREQITHVPLDEYTDERVATLLAKMEAAKRFWPGIAKVNL